MNTVQYHDGELKRLNNFSFDGDFYCENEHIRSSYQIKKMGLIEQHSYYLQKGQKLVTIPYFSFQKPLPVHDKLLYIIKDRICSVDISGKEKIFFIPERHYQSINDFFVYDNIILVQRTTCLEIYENKSLKNRFDIEHCYQSTFTRFRKFILLFTGLELFCFTLKGHLLCSQKISPCVMYWSWFHVTEKGWIQLKDKIKGEFLTTSTFLTLFRHLSSHSDIPPHISFQTT